MRAFFSNTGYTMYIYLLLFCILSAPLLSLQGCTPHDPAGSQSAREVPAFRAMSFNIRYNNPGDGEHAWPNRVDRVASTILFNQADLVGVQEALKGQLDDLALKLPGYEWIGVGRDDGKEAGEYSAIFYRTARFEPVDSGTFWLSKNPSIPGSKDWDAAITRVATWAHFRDIQADTSLFHFNTHFDHRGEMAREKSAALLENRIARMAGAYPAVLTGDFNFTQEAPGYPILTRSLKDALYESEEPHHGPLTTFYGFEVKKEPGRRIDYVFVTDNIKVLQHATLSDNWEGAFASDHLAVVATLKVE